MIKIDGEWLLKYFQVELGLELPDGHDLYQYLKEWDGNYDSIVKRFQNYPPSKSIPALMYALAIVRPTGMLEMGRAAHRLTLCYGIDKSSSVVINLLESKKIDGEFLECLRGDPKLPGDDKKIGILDRFFNRMMDRDFERYLKRTGEDLKTGPYAKRKTSLMLYLQMCALAAIHDMIIAFGELNKQHQDIRDEILDFLEISIQENSWQGVCEKGSLEYDEIQEISRDIARNKFSYYWDTDCFGMIGKGDKN